LLVCRLWLPIIDRCEPRPRGDRKSYRDTDATHTESRHPNLNKYSSETMVDSAPKHCSLLRMIIRPREIHYLRFTLEAYEGLATLTTLEPQLGLVQLNVAPGCEGDVLKILEAERERLQSRFTSTAENG
jgi:hypothetical protein